MGRSEMSGEAALDVLDQLGWFDASHCLVTLRLTPEQFAMFADACVRQPSRSTEEFVVEAVSRNFNEAAAPQSRQTKKATSGIAVPDAAQTSSQKENYYVTNH